ncbi:hypothetical protein L0156_07435 [bacterium]|nr:hypothetical protein [bacterium]
MTRIIYTTITSFVLIAFLSLSGEAQVSVHIGDIPGRALVYSPLYIIGAITNEGTEDIVVPTAWNKKNGWQVDISPANEHLSRSPEPFRMFDDVVLLHPGEKYYVSYNLGPLLSKNGVYEVRITLTSSGRCSVAESDAQQLRMPTISALGTRRQYSCWQGMATSNIVKVLVESPVVAEDKNALNYIISGEAYRETKIPHALEVASKSSIESKFAFSYTNLKAKFPHSYYTFAAGIYAEPAYIGGDPIGNLEELLELQPYHPLAETARGRWALQVVSRPEHPTHKGELDIPSLKVPDAVKDFIRQQKRNVSERKNKEHLRSDK